MRINSIQQKYTKNKNYFPFLLGGILLLLISSKIDFSNFFPAPPLKTSYYCGAEKSDGKVFKSDGHEFLNGQTQSKEKARSGKYSSKLDQDNIYSLGFKLVNPKPRTTYKVEIWNYKPNGGPSFLAIAGEKPSKFYHQTNVVSRIDKNGWQLIETVFTVPNDAKATYSIYLFKEKDERIAYVDDLKITELDNISDLKFSIFNPITLSLQVSPKNMKSLEAAKERYLSQGLIIQGEDDRVKAKVISKAGSGKAKIRYKGDWLDHLRGKKNSFRIEMNPEQSWNGLQTFSVQNPSTRGFLNEWVFHQFLNYVDVLSPRYDFIKLQLNNKAPSIYAYEEHFTKNLVESQLRREGPIVKFTENRYWDSMKRNIEIRKKSADFNDKNKAYWASELKPFKEGKTSKNPTLANAFEVAQNLLHQYKFGLKKPSEIFDLDRMAKYLAILDITDASHSLTWHNQRFYYNPVTALLEPIGFDGYAGAGNYWSDRTLHAERIYTKQHDEFEPLYALFFDKDFLKLYFKYLKKYSDPDFMDLFLAQIDEELSKRERFIRSEHGSYSFDKKGLKDRANKISSETPPYPNSLQAFSQKNDNKLELSLLNEHILPLEVIGFDASSIQKPTNSIFVFPQKTNELPKYEKISVPNTAKEVYYRLPGIDSVYKKEIAIWTTPNDWSPRQELLAQLKTQKNQVPYKEKGDLIVFKKQKYTIKKPLVLPKDKNVIIEAGSVFEFSEKGFLLSFSPIEMQGELENPIIIESLDQKSGAIVVMQTKAKSLLRHVIFKNQNTLSYKGWNLTGAVTFYESDVRVMACQFLNNHCEDALNIVRSDFKVEKCAFRNIFSDAFDADFCNGEVLSSSYDIIGNDALDFSTSVINIKNCQMTEVGDKAISAGEQATISAKNIHVNKANIGFASKDKSVLTLHNITLKNAKTGITAYQKKPEFGSATIHLSKYDFEEVKFPFLIEEGSILNKN
ncbi:MAG: hypothetical protein ACPGXZ_05650 [Saprospiraceae bacterium]